MNNKGADQTGQMHTLVCAYVVRKPPKTSFLTWRPILYVLFLNALEILWMPLSISLLCFLPKFVKRLADIIGACILSMPPGAWGREVKVIGRVEICDVSSKILVFVCVYASHPSQQLCPPKLKGEGHIVALFPCIIF